VSADAGGLDPEGLTGLVGALARAGRTVAVAESLTAGQVSARLGDVPGVSAVLRGGVVAYATDVKASVLGVDAALLAEQGPVHPQVALQMADGVRRLLGADLGLATTGVAGPGPQDGHPAGTVYIAVTSIDAPAGATVSTSHLQGEVEGLSTPGRQVRRLQLPGDRAGVRARATAAVLALLAVEAAHPLQR
jgi:nicotinamide-nucleotide amidase